MTTVPSVSTSGLPKLNGPPGGTFAKFDHEPEGACSGENADDGVPAGAGPSGGAGMDPGSAATGGRPAPSCRMASGLSFNVCHMPCEIGTCGCDPAGWACTTGAINIATI